MKYKHLSADLQINFFFRLKDLRAAYLIEALRRTVKSVEIAAIDAELVQHVPAQALQRLASFSLRGEVVFPVPVLIRANPFLIGYYRLLYGFSQKEFYDKGPFGSFKHMEERGRINTKSLDNIDELCKSLVISGVELVEGLDEISLARLNELQLLTVGPQFRGSRNNEYGQRATQLVFDLIKQLVVTNAIESTEKTITVKNDSGRLVKIAFTSDPDIEITEMLPTKNRFLISMEIKGGADLSNIHNRIGEAEKSHQKARNRGCNEFVTIVNVEIDYEVLRKESPTTTHFFHISRLMESAGEELASFKDLLSSILGVRI